MKSLIKPVGLIVLSALLIFIGCTKERGRGTAQLHKTPQQLDISETGQKVESENSASGATKTNIDGLDLNGDGMYDTIKFECIKHSNTFSLSINDASVTGEGDNLDGYYKIVDIDSTDNFKEISISASGPSDDYVTYFYYYDGQNICPMGWVEGSYAVKTDGSGILKTQTRGGIIHTWFYPDSYKLSKDHELEHIDQDLYIMNCPVTMNDSLPLQKARDDSTIIVILLPGDEVTILSTDNKEWCLVRNSKGIEGWFAVDGYDMIRKTGKHASEVFGGLNYAD